MDIVDAFPRLKGRNVIVFDRECILCSGFFRFVGEQSPLGAELYDLPTLALI